MHESALELQLELQRYDLVLLQDPDTGMYWVETQSDPSVGIFPITLSPMLYNLNHAWNWWSVLLEYLLGEDES